MRMGTKELTVALEQHLATRMFRRALAEPVDGDAFHRDVLPREDGRVLVREPADGAHRADVLPERVGVRDRVIECSKARRSLVEGDVRAHVGERDSVLDEEPYLGWEGVHGHGGCRGR